ncbi:parallel beta-helix domain-containing protein [Rapidithrix thailandica]|uniref:Parallel beta-helix domain-containing protein n=1 Tax=Rapidithrix thailandica TaxID=413964 RepID=A0AAW9SFR7_9BACT
MYRLQTYAFHLSLAFLILTGSYTFAQEGTNYQDKEKALQTRLIMAQDGDVIEIEEGFYQFKGSLSMDGKKNITIKGQGMDKTILSFKGQITGAEGLKITGGENITLRDFTVQDAKGDCIKTQNIDGISFINIKAEWTNKPNKNNGAYALYPVSCNNVLMDSCVAIGSSDAGVYVGQSKNIIVRNCVAYHNVAGIEIENSINADVYNNHAYNNTGGILVFDLPDLPQKHGRNIRVFDNLIEENNYKNFSPKGNIVNKVPPGTGVMIMATENVEVFHNKIHNNRTASVVIVSYHITEEEIKDQEYNAYPKKIYVHHNDFIRPNRSARKISPFGWLFYFKFGRKVPHIIYDGIPEKNSVDENGRLKASHQICISNNKNGTFANLDAANKFKGLSRDTSLFTCELKSLSPAKVANVND